MQAGHGHPNFTGSPGSNLGYLGRSGPARTLSCLCTLCQHSRQEQRLAGSGVTCCPALRRTGQGGVPVEQERVPLDLCLHARHLLQRLVQPPLADVAPGAGQVAEHGDCVQERGRGEGGEEC